MPPPPPLPGVVLRSRGPLGTYLHALMKGIVVGLPTNHHRPKWGAGGGGSLQNSFRYYTPLPLNLAGGNTGQAIKQAGKQQATSTSPFRFGHYLSLLLRALLY